MLSIFVNPLQFDRSTDFDAYPRPIDDDVSRCRDVGVDAVYAPTAASMYPAGFQTHVMPGALGEVTFTQSPTRTTVYRLLVRHAEGTPPRAVSDNLRVVVRTASSLSIRGRTTPDGYAVSGILRGGGGPIGGAPVALQVLGEDGVTWTEVDSALTKRRGKVQFLEPISEGTSYRLAYAGGAHFAPSVSGVVVN